MYRYATAAPGADLCKEYVLPFTSYPEQDNAVLNDQNGQKSKAEQDKDAWKAASDADVLQGYEAYIRVFPDGRHGVAAKWRLQQIKEYGYDIPSSNHGERKWKDAITDDSIDSYKNFLKSYSSDEDLHVQQARRRLAQLSLAAISRANSSQKIAITRAIPDGKFLLEPSCVICSRTANLGNIAVSSEPHLACANGGGDFYINPRLKSGWVYIRNDNDPATSVQYIGQSQGYILYAKDSEAFNQFVIFVLQAAAEGGSKVDAGSNPATPTSQLSTPPQ